MQKGMQTIQCLLDAGADINAQDKNGASALHRAVRTRCAAAVKCLLEAGSGAKLKNKPGPPRFTWRCKTPAAVELAPKLQKPHSDRSSTSFFRLA